MLIILIRTGILYTVVLFVLRIMGKSELSKMSPFQLVIIFMIAELASIPIESPTVSLINGVTAIFALLFLQVLFSLLSIKSEKFKILISGRPSVLIEQGQINEKELKALRISINDLMEQLRLGNAPSVADISYAVMESNGDLSIIPRAECKPLTAKDMNIVKAAEVMPLVVISDGCLYSHNLKPMGYNENQLKGELLTLGLTDYKQVFLAFCDEKKQLHVYVRSCDGKAREIAHAVSRPIISTAYDEVIK